MVRINETTKPFQYVADFKAAESIRQAGMPTDDVWENTAPEGWFACISQICCFPFTFLKNLFYKIFGSYWEKKPITLKQIYDDIVIPYNSLGHPTFYRNSFANLPESLKQGFLQTTMKMLMEGKLLRPEAKPPEVASEEELKKLAEEVLANPLHPQFTIKPVFEDYLKKLKF